MRHNDLTIVAVYGHNNGGSAVPSLLRSKRALPGSRALLISESKPPLLPDEIEWKPVFSMSYQQYSVFCFYSLPYYVETDYCLIVQDDGWVLNGDAFTADYYEYDYIGAPAHAALIGSELHMNFTWTNNPVAIPVQNGGLSLRSRKFMEAPARFGITYIPFSMQPLCNEDVQLTAIRRKELEQVGIKFAPNEVARQFSVEYMGHNFHEVVDFDRLVGHHAPSRKLLADSTIYCKWAPDFANQFFREGEFMSFLQRKGYDIIHGNSREV